MYPIRWKAVLILITLCAVAMSAGASDAPAIETAFAQYREALLEGDGAKAADNVSERTIAFYGGIVKHVLNTPRAELAELDFLSKFMILRIRQEFTRAEIERMTGRSLLALGVSKGWISKSTVADIEKLVDIKVKGSEASASLPSVPDFPAFHFRKESGQWKLDLVASFALANEAMKEQITQSGLTEEQFIIRVLNSLSSKKVDERIFSPPLPPG